MERRLSACKLGPRFQGVTFDQYIPANDRAAKVKAFCQEWAGQFADHRKTGASIVMVGRCGTGKNTLSAAICNEVMKQGQSALHTTAMKLVRHIKETWRDREKSEQAAINEFSMPALLVIDEVGVQFGSPTEQLFLTEVINDRYESLRPTILISNLPLNELESLLGTRVIDRFHEGQSRVIVFDWESYRRKQQ
jgi:DNA replication protein DnaC